MDGKRHLEGSAPGGNHGLTAPRHCLDADHLPAAREPECPRTASRAVIVPLTRNATRSHSSSAVTMSCVVRIFVAPAFADLANDVSNQTRGDRIEAGGRLVEKQEFGAMQQRSRQRE